MNISYLKNGNQIQKQAFKILDELNIMNTLSAFHPVLTGTIPLDIDIPGSDLDIICDFTGADVFYKKVRDSYSSYPGFTIRKALFQDLETVVASFKWDDFELEIFGQSLPVTQQNAYRHMVTENRLLEAAGPEAREAIRELKKSGYKTEPAFARYFKIPGDPYRELYKMYEYPEDRLKQIASGI